MDDDSLVRHATRRFESLSSFFMPGPVFHKGTICDIGKNLIFFENCAFFYRNRQFFERLRVRL
jgi:hypothetical protein